MPRAPENASIFSRRSRVVVICAELSVLYLHTEPIEDLAMENKSRSSGISSKQDHSWSWRGEFQLHKEVRPHNNEGRFSSIMRTPAGKRLTCTKVCLTDAVGTTNESRLVGQVLE